MEKKTPGPSLLQRIVGSVGIGRSLCDEGDGKTGACGTCLGPQTAAASRKQCCVNSWDTVVMVQYLMQTVNTGGDIT